MLGAVESALASATKKLLGGEVVDEDHEGAQPERQPAAGPGRQRANDRLLHARQPAVPVAVVREADQVERHAAIPAGHGAAVGRVDPVGAWGDVPGFRDDAPGLIGLTRQQVAGAHVERPGGCECCNCRQRDGRPADVRSTAAESHECEFRWPFAGLAGGRRNPRSQCGINSGINRV